MWCRRCGWSEEGSEVALIFAMAMAHRKGCAA